MAHVAKFGAGASGHMISHYDRSKENISGNIDWDRTHLNYNLAPEREGSQLDFIHQRLGEIKVQKRKDVNVFCDWVVTLPKYEYCNKDIHITPDREKVERLFFERTYQFLVDRYGEKNVISAYVHKDEKTPHMHFAFVPATEDKKWNEKHPDSPREKLSAKDVLTRMDLKSFHSDLEHHLDKFHDWHFEILNEATKNGNKSISELKKQTCLDEIKMAEQSVLKAHKMALEASDIVKGLKREKKALEDEISVLRTEKDVLTKAEVESMKGEKNLLGGLKGVTHKEFEALKRTAVAVESMAAERDQALARVNEAEQQVANAEARVSRAYADANQQLKTKIQEVERDRPSLKAQQDIIRLSRENEVLKKDLKRYKTIASDLAEIVRNELPEVYKMLFRTPEKQVPEKSKSKSYNDELER